MKKQLVALSLIVGLTMATVASADWGRGGRGYNNYGNCPQLQGQMMQGPTFQQLDQPTRDQIRQFFKDNQPLYKQLAMKRAEKQALMRSDNPDPKAVGKVTGEMFDLRTTLQEKAELAGVDQYVGPGCMGGRGGRGRGFGMGQGGGMMNGGSQQ
jgi:Spy/CpxP family protein refolding chaperone